MDPQKKFEEEVQENIRNLSSDQNLKSLSLQWMIDSAKYKWSYNFKWMGRPAIQFPNDTWAMQEIIWKYRPDLIIETGIAHGGSLIYYASMLALLDVVDCLEKGVPLEPTKTRRKVLGLDIDIRSHNKREIEEHPLSVYISMIEGSSTAETTIDKVHIFAKNFKRVLVCLDSNHTHEHVLNELQAYAPLITEGGYCVVFDTVLDGTPAEASADRPWGPGNSPKTAVDEFLRLNENFAIDYAISDKLLITVAPGGFLKRVAK